MKRYKFVAGVAVLLAIHANGGEDVDKARSLMAMAKFAGACGILSQMVTFQESTKMPGGDEMIERFWTTEAARLGMSIQSFADSCKRAINGYDKLMAATEPAAE